MRVFSTHTLHLWNCSIWILGKDLWGTIPAFLFSSFLLLHKVSFFFSFFFYSLLAVIIASSLSNAHPLTSSFEWVVSFSWERHKKRESCKPLIKWCFVRRWYCYDNLFAHMQAVHPLTRTWNCTKYGQATLQTFPLFFFALVMNFLLLISAQGLCWPWWLLTHAPMRICRQATLHSCARASQSSKKKKR